MTTNLVLRESSFAIFCFLQEDVLFTACNYCPYETVDNCYNYS